MSLEVNPKIVDNLVSVNFSRPFIDRKYKIVDQMQAIHTQLAILPGKMTQKLQQVQGMLTGLNTKPKDEQVKIMQHVNALRNSIITQQSEIEQRLRTKLQELQSALKITDSALQGAEGLLQGAN